jgi:hypothetical protein
MGSVLVGPKVIPLSGVHCNQKQSITADTLKIFAEGDLLIVIIGLMFSVSRCPKVITLSGFS